MDAAVWRLSWALPLVLLIGVLFMLWLKRLGVGQAPKDGRAAGAHATHDLIVLSDTRLSEHTRCWVIDVHGQAFVVLESAGQVQLQPLAPRASEAPWPHAVSAFWRGKRPAS